MHCPICNKTVPNNALFCIYCGARINNKHKFIFSKRLPEQVMPILVIVGVISILSLVGLSAAIISSLTSTSPINNMETIAPTEAPTPSESPQDVLVQLVKNNVGNRLIAAQLTQSGGLIIARIAFKGADNLTSKMIQNGMLDDSKKICQDLYEKKELNIDRTDIRITFPLVDVYGNTSEQFVMRMSLTKETAAKINWKYFLNKNIPIVMDEFWMHPAIGN